MPQITPAWTSFQLTISRTKMKRMKKMKKMMMTGYKATMMKMDHGSTLEERNVEEEKKEKVAFAEEEKEKAGARGDFAASVVFDTGGVAALCFDLAGDDFPFELDMANEKAKAKVWLGGKERQARAKAKG